MITGHPKKFLLLLAVGIVFPFLSRAATPGVNNTLKFSNGSLTGNLIINNTPTANDEGIIFDVTTGEYDAESGCGLQQLPYNFAQCTSYPAPFYHLGGTYSLVFATLGGSECYVDYDTCKNSGEYHGEYIFTINAAGGVVIPPGAAAQISQNLSSQVADPGTVRLLALIAGIFLTFYVIHRLTRIVPHDKAIEHAKAVEGHTRKLLDRL